MTITFQLNEIIARENVKELREYLREGVLANRENIPDELKALPRWLVWTVTKFKNRKFNKIPFYPAMGVKRAGTQGGPEDIRTPFSIGVTGRGHQVSPREKMVFHL